jgi:FAD/FMN-containing dehydrogenase
MATASTSELLRDLKGRLITPDDADYDQMRTVYGGGFDSRPSLIARVADDTDVVRVIRHAREAGLELAIMSGGHSFAGHSTTDGGILLDLRDMKALDIDTEQRTIWAETGVTSGDVTRRAEADGLVVGFGDTASVGIGGITLGGGIGYLVRKYGLTIDSLLAADLVTADGRVLRVDADTHPDLFWAIRGGGGNFGVATRFRFALHPIDTVVGGVLMLPATVDTIEGFMAEAEAAPEELSSIANVMRAPPMPFLPEEVHGKIVLLAFTCYAGEAEAGERAIAPFRALAEPLADMVKPMPYPEIYPPDDPDYHPLAISRNLFMDTIGLEEAATMLAALGASDAAMRVAQLRVLGGAYARVPPDATAYAHRDRPIMVNVASFYEGAEDQVVRERWVAELAEALRQGPDAAYVNFVADEGEDRIHAAYPGATWDRLAAIKARYDANNLFRSNQNVPPAGNRSTRAD